MKYLLLFAFSMIVFEASAQEDSKELLEIEPHIKTKEEFLRKPPSGFFACFQIFSDFDVHHCHDGVKLYCQSGGDIQQCGDQCVQSENIRAPRDDNKCRYGCNAGALYGCASITPDAG